MSQVIKPQDFLNYMVEQFNIKSGSKITALDITHELNSLSNPFEFVQFVKQNIGNAKYDFKNGLQKFNAMIFDYKENLKRSVCSDVDTKARQLAQKCSIAIRSLYENAPAGFTLFSYSQIATYNTFPNYFDRREIEILDAVGGCKRWMNEYDEDLFLAHIIKEMNSRRISHYCKNLISRPINQDTLVLEQLSKRG